MILVALALSAAVAPAAAGTTVSGVTVTAPRRHEVDAVEVNGDWCAERQGEDGPGPAPQVVDSWPRPGGMVPGGPLTLRLTFDRPMTCVWAIDYGDADEICDSVGVWDMPRRRTWSMRCRVRPEQAVSLHFGAVENTRFRSRTGVNAAPYELSFRTSGSATTVDPGSGETVTATLACRSGRGLFGFQAPCRYKPVAPPP